MSQYSRYGNWSSNNRQSGTPMRRPSVISNVSGIADSTISFNTLVTGESLQLSQFPAPPRYTPLSPVQSEVGSFSTSSGRREDGRSTYSMSPSLASERGLPISQSPIPPVPPLPSQPGSSPRAPLRTDASSISQTSRTLSPFDWHEGASSIDVDVAEDRLLPTSFITQLLRENPEPNSRRNQHISSNSDGLSGFSELTYPPPPHRISVQFPRGTPPRPMGGRPSPSSSAHLHRAGSQSDSDTLITTSGDDYNRYNSRNPNVQGNSVVGVTSATLRAVPPSSYQPVGKSQYPEDAKGNLDDYKLVQYGKPPAAALPARSFSDNQQSQRENRKSISTRSFVSSFISRAPSTSSRSVHSFRKAFGWMRKPLPPVPAIPPKYAQPVPVPRHHEEDLPLPELINRADTLSNLLEKGYHPHRSLTSSFFTQGDSQLNPQGLSSAFDDHGNPDAMNLSNLNWASGQKTMADDTRGALDGDGKPTIGHLFTKKRTRVAIVLVLTLLVAVAVALGVILGKKNGNSFPKCSGNFTGAACNLDATCVCTSSTPCLPLAQHLATLQPAMNTLFNTNYTLNSLATSLWLAQGDPSGGNCASQAMLVDVAPSLTESQPNRTKWAQSALLWNLAQSQDVETVQKLRNFVIKAPWKDLDSSDGPTDAAASSFTTAGSGFAFNFAAQTLVPVTNVTFESGGQPSSTQKQRVSSVALGVLDRMYTFASASSTQKAKALENFWRSVLQQQASDLPAFLSTLSSAPILLPFNGDSNSVISLLPNATSFPPPISCYPSLNTSQIQNINTLETSVFNLPLVSPASTFQPSCFPDRPVYGVLDILKLRLPFLDSRTGAIAKQAVLLKREAYPRAIVYTNEALGALPFGDGSVADTNPLSYGTLSNFKHVVFNYLSSIPDVNTAIAFVRFVLSNTATPPTNSSQLFSSLSRIPPMEVAVFGTVDVTDVASVASSFATPSGSLFFGSEPASTMRQWAIGAGSSVTWTEFATSPQVVRDSSFTDPTFNQTWLAASANLHTAGVSDVVNSFSSTNKFSP